MVDIQTSKDEDIQTSEDDMTDLRKGTITFRRHNPSDPIKDIMDRDFWVVDSLWLRKNGETLHPDDSNLPNEPPPVNPSLILSTLESTETHPKIWLAADRLAKSFYSTILTDLGQTTASPNILLNETALRYYTQDFAYTWHEWAENQNEYELIATPGPGNGSYEALKNTTGTLGTSPSVISTKYLCQVPRQKSTGSIIVSVVIADLVFLQALWRLFTLIANAWLTKSHAEANYCAGCVARHKSDGMADLGHTQSGNEGMSEERRPSSAETISLVESRNAPYMRLQDAEQS
ncbi:hypothetical protein MMC29_008391 [Sticta canariensis]|nr:hypothetical protein [Sticta canariensis]